MLGELVSEDDANNGARRDLAYVHLSLSTTRRESGRTAPAGEQEQLGRSADEELAKAAALFQQLDARGALSKIDRKTWTELNAASLSAAAHR